MKTKLTIFIATCVLLLCPGIGLVVRASAESASYNFSYPEGSQGLSRYPYFYLRLPKDKAVTVEIVAKPQVGCTITVGEEGKPCLGIVHNATKMHFSTRGLAKENNTLLLSVQPRATDEFFRHIKNGGRWTGEVIVRWP